MFVSASGYLYCNNKNNLTEYKFFGSIFDSKNFIKMKNYIGDNENEWRTEQITKKNSQWWNV